MPHARANGIEIAYDTFGAPKDQPIVLIMGLGRQLVFWDEDFCKGLARRGLYVIRLDNRDSGFSTKFESGGKPDLGAAFTAMLKGEPVDAPYTLDDMADDTVGLLGALGYHKAHFCGVSMGAAIVQTIGYRYPDRVLSLIPIMGSTGNPDLPQAKPEAMNTLLEPAPAEREAYISYAVKTWKTIGGSIQDDEDDIRHKAALEYDRMFYPQGMLRQMAAIMAHGNRKPRLARVKAPTLVIHGSDDPLIPPEGGRDTAEAIDGAELMIIDGMGHSLPRKLWPKIIDAIDRHTAKA
jgi:pimeloyl-ACP methyl ester carboxylesterase